MINKVHTTPKDPQNRVLLTLCLGGGIRIGNVRSNGKMYEWSSTRSLNNWGGGSSWGKCRRDGKGKG